MTVYQRNCFLSASQQTIFIVFCCTFQIFRKIFCDIKKLSYLNKLMFNLVMWSHWSIPLKYFFLFFTKIQLYIQLICMRILYSRFDLQSNDWWSLTLKKLWKPCFSRFQGFLGKDTKSYTRTSLVWWNVRTLRRSSSIKVEMFLVYKFTHDTIYLSNITSGFNISMNHLPSLVLVQSWARTIGCCTQYLNVVVPPILYRYL